MNKQLTRWIAALGLCALQYPSPAFAESTGDLVVIDLRPQNERDGTGLSPLTGSCNKGVFRIADVASDPVKVEGLRTALSQHLGLAADGKTLTVLNWSVYYNKQVASSGPSLGNIGVQGYSLPGKKKEKPRGSKCSREESAGGWYQSSDVSSGYPPIVSEFSGTFAGKPFNVRIVHSPHRKIEGKFQGDPGDTQELLDAVQETAEALATAIVQ